MVGTGGATVPLEPAEAEGLEERDGEELAPTDVGVVPVQAVSPMKPATRTAARPRIDVHQTCRSGQEFRSTRLHPRWNLDADLRACLLIETQRPQSTEVRLAGATALHTVAIPAVFYTGAMVTGVT